MMASAQVPAVITYHKPGTRPPLYVAGTFSSPSWQACEMDYAIREDGEYEFKKEVSGEPGSKIQYKFRIGDGEWWVLKDDGPTETDSSGNTNHVLEVKPQEESTDKQAPGEAAGPTYAQAAAKRLQLSAEAAATDRSSTGTPIFARVAAEVADSAEMLHEEVPDRESAEQEKPQDATPTDKGPELASISKSKPATDTPEMFDRRQSTIVILEPPPGEGRPFEVQPRGDEYPHDQEDYIADRSPLFAHECAGLYESDEEEASEEDVGEHEGNGHRSASFDELYSNDVDLNDPTLERFPSNRQDIMDAVRKLETGLQADDAAFSGNPRSPVVNPSRRGTEDITGDFELFAPQEGSSSAQRPSKKSPHGSLHSIPTTGSLESISEAEEAEDELFRPAVVFSNPLKAKPKHLKLPTSEDDEGIALPEGVSPRTVKPTYRRITTPEGSPPESPPSPRTTRKSFPHDTSKATETDRAASTASTNGKNVEGPSYAQVAAPEPTPQAGEASKDDSKSTGTWHDLDDPKPAAAAPAHPSVTRRLSYAEVAASSPPSTNDTKPPAEEDKGKAKASSDPTPAAQPDDDSQPEDDNTTTTTETNTILPSLNTLRRRAAAAVALAARAPYATPPTESGASSPMSGSASPLLRATPSSATRAVVRPRRAPWGGWVGGILRMVFVDWVGALVRRVLGVVCAVGRWFGVGVDSEEGQGESQEDRREGEEGRETVWERERGWARGERRWSRQGTGAGWTEGM